MEYKVETKFNKHRIEQETKLVDNFGDTVQNISRKVMNLEEQGIIDALAVLGWTPPPVEKPNFIFTTGKTEALDLNAVDRRFTITTPTGKNMYCCDCARDCDDNEPGDWHSKDCGNYI